MHGSWRASLRNYRGATCAGALGKEIAVRAERRSTRRCHRCGHRKKRDTAVTPLAGDAPEASFAPKRVAIASLAAVWRDAEVSNHAVHQFGLARNQPVSTCAQAEVGHRCT